MKKAIALSLVCLLLLGCQAQQPAQTSTSPNIEELTAVSLLSNIWASYDDTQRFAACGGAMEQPVDNAPGALDMTNTQELAARYLVPEDRMDMLAEGASLVHMMNSHIFTACAVRVTGDEEGLVQAWRQNIQDTQWLCSWPDRLLIVKVGNYILLSFGLEDTMSVFRGKLDAVYPGAVIVIDEAIAV